MKEEDQLYYDELFELSKHELVLKVMSAEECITANDDEMQKQEARIKELQQEVEDFKMMLHEAMAEIEYWKDPTTMIRPPRAWTAYKQPPPQ